MSLPRSLAVLLLTSAALRAQVVAPPGPPVTTPVVPACTAAPQDDCSRGWIEAEYLLWWTKGQPVPVPLVTAAPDGSTALFPGAIGNPDTRLLLGNETVDGPERHGFRIAGGWWLSDSVGVDASYFRLINETTTRGFASDGLPGSSFLALPYRTPAGVEESGPFAIPGLLSGSAAVSFETRLQGADLNAALRLGGGGQFQADLLVGARWVSLDERLTLNSAITGIPGDPLLAGFTANLTDRFEARNDFYGGQIGTRVRADFDRVFVAATAKVALGVVEQNVRVSGLTTGTPPFLPVDPNGFYAATTNSGSFNRTRFAVVPEVGLKVGYRITDAIFATVGYNFLYISDVARPGNAIDRTVNTSQFAGGPLVGEARPAPTLRNDSFWAHGLTFGLGFRF